MQTRRLAALVLAATLVAACGAAASSAPTATTTPSLPVATLVPTAEPTAPPDVAALVQAQADSLNSGTMTFDATATIGQVQTELAGSATFNGIESSTRLTVTLAGSPTTVLSVAVGGRTYARTGEGPWLEVGGAPARSVTAQLQQIAAGSLTDAGTTMRNGVTVHRLVPRTGTSFDPSAIVPGASGARIQQVDITLFATDDGRLVGASIEASFTVASGETSVAGTVSVDMRFSALGVKQTIRPPDDVWTTFTSSRFHASIAYPDAFEYEKMKTDEMFWSPDYGGAGLFRVSASGGTLSEWASGTLSELKKEFRTKTGSNEPATLAGTKARLVTVSGKADDGSKVVVHYAIAVKGKYVYGVWWVSRAGNESADLVTFRQMLSTFAFTA
jgi:hypothetical protein